MYELYSLILAILFKIAKKIKEKNKVIHCSTDSNKIKNVSLSYGIDTSFLRPKKISKNHSRDLDFVNYTLKMFFKKGFKILNTNMFKHTH